MTARSLPLLTGNVPLDSAIDSVPEKLTLVPSDNELMVLIQKGNQEAFGQVFDRYYPAVRSIARKMLRNPEDVADVVQESFLDVFQNARSFTPSKGTLKAWISCIAYHRSLKRLRRLTRQDWQHIDPKLAEFIEDLAVRPERFIRAFDFRRCLDRALKILHEKHRRTMVLYFFEGQELSAIALELGESLGNTRHGLYRGLAKLRKELVQRGLLEGYIEFKDARKEDEVSG